MTQAQLQQLAALAQALGIGGIVSEGNGRTRKSRGRSKNGRFSRGPVNRKWSADELAERDRDTIVSFSRKGYKDVVLAPRNADGSVDLTKPHNVRPFGKAATVDAEGKAVPATGWIAEGRVVRKGQHGVNGLFHITQTDPLPAKAN